MHNRTTIATAFLLLFIVPISSIILGKDHDETPQVSRGMFKDAYPMSQPALPVVTQGKGGIAQTSFPITSSAPSGSSLPSLEPTVAPSRSPPRRFMTFLPTKVMNGKRKAGEVEGKKGWNGNDEDKNEKTAESKTDTARAKTIPKVRDMLTKEVKNDTAKANSVKLTKIVTRGKGMTKAPMNWTPSPSGSTLPSVVPSIMPVPVKIQWKKKGGNDKNDETGKMIRPPSTPDPSVIFVSSTATPSESLKGFNMNRKKSDEQDQHVVTAVKSGAKHVKGNAN